MHPLPLRPRRDHVTPTRAGQGKRSIYGNIRFRRRQRPERGRKAGEREAKKPSALSLLAF